MVVAQRDASDGWYYERPLAVDVLGPDDPLHQDPDAVALTERALDHSAVRPAATASLQPGNSTQFGPPITAWPNSRCGLVAVVNRQNGALIAATRACRRHRW